MQREEVRSPTLIASTLGIVIAQAVFLYSFFYWFGFSAVSEISIIRYFTLLELFTGVADGRLALLLVLLLLFAVLHTALIAQRERQLGFIDDLSVKVPPSRPEQASTNTVRAATTANTGNPERYMTNAELNFFSRWQRMQQFARWNSFFGLTLSLGGTIYLWMSGKRAEAIYFASFVVSFAGTLLAVSNVWAFVFLPIRNALSAVLFVCSLSASMGARDAVSLLKNGESTHFQPVIIKAESVTIVGLLIIQTSSATLVFDSLRRFTQVPTGKITEIRYLPH